MQVQGLKLSTEPGRITRVELRMRRGLQLSLGNAQGTLGTGAEHGQHARVSVCPSLSLPLLLNVSGPSNLIGQWKGPKED